MRLLFDMDGVLANLTEKWYSHYNRDYGDNMTPSRVTHWGVEDFVKPECGIKIHDYINTPGFFADLNPLPGAIEGVRQLHDTGHEIIIVSASVPNAYLDKHNWIVKHLPFVDTHNIVFTHNKAIIDGDALVDDGPHNLERFYNHDNSKLCVVVDTPFNKNLKSYTACFWGR